MQTMPCFTSLSSVARLDSISSPRVGLWLALLMFLPLLLVSCRRAPRLSQRSTNEAAIATASPSTPINFTEQWVISASEARALWPQAVLLDARGNSPLKNPLGTNSLKGAIAVTWQQFSESQAPQRGNLLQNLAELGKRLQAVGIDGDRPVIVFGNPSQGWGEEGRIVWMLRSLGHQQAVLVDGGYEALKAAGLSPGKAISTAARPGNFAPQAQTDWQINQAELRATMAQPEANLALIDTREPREFAGATPYGESRGGHLPGAVNLHFSQLLDDQGYLLPDKEIRDRLTVLGITPDQTIIAYCTGGIRSGWLTAVLLELGYDVKNYAGSMWEWSAGDASTYPLEKS